MKTAEEAGITLDDLAAAAGVEPRTIRHYVKEGLLPPPLRRGRGATYPEEALDRARAIKVLQGEARIGLEQIRQVFEDVDEEMIRKVGSGEERVVPIGFASHSSSRVTRADQADVADGEREAVERLLRGLRNLCGTETRGRRQSAIWTRVSVTEDIELSMRGPLSKSESRQLQEIAEALTALMRECAAE